MLDKLVIACKLPCDGLFGIFGGEVELFQGHSLPNICPLQHILGLELDGEVSGVILVAVNFLDV